MLIGHFLSLEKIFLLMRFYLESVSLYRCLFADF